MKPEMKETVFIAFVIFMVIFLVLVTLLAKQ